MAANPVFSFSPKMKFAATAPPGKKLAFAHYMVAGIRSFDNVWEPDGYDKAYLDPNGEGGIHTAYGGWSRNRPTFRSPITAPAGSTWQIEDAKFEVAMARQAGLDGFAMWIPNVTGNNVTRLEAMWEGALRQDPTFLMRLMPDLGATIGSVDADQFVAFMLQYAQKPNTMRLADGRLVISPYHADLKKSDLSWWQYVVDQCAKAGETVAFVPIMVNYTSVFNTLPYVYATGVWGSRSPATTNPTSSGQLGYAADAHANNKLWVQNVALQDVRPSQYIYDEALGSQTLVNTVQLAVNTKADWVDLETWNDPAEHSGFYPSRNFGTLALELWRRLSPAWSSGTTWAADDSVLLLHRPHFAADKPSYAGYAKDANGNITGTMKLRNPSSPAADIIEISSWFQQETSLTLQVNGAAVGTFNAPAGYYRTQLPLVEGTIALVASRSGKSLTLRTPTAVTHQPYVQDMTYWGAWGVLGAS